MSLTRSYPFHDVHHVCGARIQSDSSGRGHAWRNVPKGELLPSVEEIISAEILDGHRPTGQACIGGEHFRWVVDSVDGSKTCINGRWCNRR